MIKTFMDKPRPRRRPRQGRQVQVRQARGRAGRACTASTLAGRRPPLDVVHTLKTPATRPTSSAARCATCCWACARRTSTSPPMPRPSRSRACSGAPSSSVGASASCTWSAGRAASTRVIEVRPRAHLDSADAEQVSGQRAHQQDRAGRHEARGRCQRPRAARQRLGVRSSRTPRRDFTINAMYYDPETQTVVDFTTASATRTSRAAHDRRPGHRYREDPVRIIRAVRFAAKLWRHRLQFEGPGPAGNRIAPSLGCWPTCRRAASSTRWSLLQTGHALASVDGSSSPPAWTVDLSAARPRWSNAREAFVRSAPLADTDRRVGEGKPVALSFLLACVLWSDVRAVGQRQPARHGAVPGAAGGGRRGVRVAHRRRLGTRQARRRHARDLADAAALRFKRTGSSPFRSPSSRVSRRLRFPRLRPRSASCPGALHWWETFSTASDAGALRHGRRDPPRAATRQGQAAKTGENKGAQRWPRHRQAADGSPLSAPDPTSSLSGTAGKSARATTGRTAPPSPSQAGPPQATTQVVRHERSCHGLCRSRTWAMRAMRR